MLIKRHFSLKLTGWIVKYVIYNVKLTLKFKFALVVMLKCCIFVLSKKTSLRINLIFEFFYRL